MSRAPASAAETRGQPTFTVYESGDKDTVNFDAWKRRRLDLSAYVNRQVQVRFEFQPYDTSPSSRAGWYIDDIEVK